MPKSNIKKIQTPPWPFDAAGVPLRFRFSVVLALAEVGLGSLMHAVRLPLAGHILSLNQVLCITRALMEEKSYLEAIRLPATISTVAALLKSLAPMGKKLTPMIALIMQGALYSFGIALLGNNILGHGLGAVLSSTWGFIQPVLIAYVIFGARLVDGFLYFQNWLSNYLAVGWWTVLLLACFCVMLKALLALVAVFIAHSAKEKFLAEYQQILLHPLKTMKSQPKRRGAFKEILTPWFMASCLFSALALHVTHATTIDLIYALLRILASAILFFWAMRAATLGWLISFLERKGHVRFSQALTETIKIFRNQTSAGN